MAALRAACFLACIVSISAASIKVAASSAQQNPTPFLDISYQVPTDAQPTDRIALYPTVVGSNISSVDPIRYQFVPSASVGSPTTAQLWTNGYVQALQAVYVRGLSHDTAQALSAAPVGSSPINAPIQARLSIGRRAGEVRVSWQTQQAGVPLVKYGTASGQYTQQQYGTFSTYSAADLCGPPANAWGYIAPGFVNTAVLQGLQPGTTYYYVYGDQVWGFSSEGSFTTPPAPGQGAQVRFLVAANLGVDSPDAAELPDDVSVNAQLKASGHLTTPGSQDYTILKSALLATGQLVPAPGNRATLQLMQQLLGGGQAFHGLLVPGGLSMAAGHQARWDDFLQQMQPVLTRVPLLAAPGDAEVAGSTDAGSAFGSVASGGECGVPYGQRLRMPSNTGRQLWYSVDQGPVHFVLLNTEQSLDPASPQFGFLQFDLSSVDRSKTPWVVVSMHRGLYVDDPADSGPGSPSATLQQQVEQLFVEQSVDMVLSGHSRLYQQSCPVIQGHCVGFGSDGSALGPVHVMLGIGGAAVPLRAQQTAPAWLLTEAFEHGLAQLTADTSSLTLQVVSSVSGQELTRFTLNKPSSWQANATAAAARFVSARQARIASTSTQAATKTAQALAQAPGQASIAQDPGSGACPTCVTLPDFEGLNTLLQEDLVAAAAAQPSVAERFTGPGSFMAKLVTSLSAGEAPAPATTWQVTMQLLQLTINVMTPGGGNFSPPPPPDTSEPPPVGPPPPVVQLPPIGPPPTPPPEPVPEPWTPSPEPVPEPWTPSPEPVPEPWTPSPEPVPEPWTPSPEPVPEPWTPSPDPSLPAPGPLPEPSSPVIDPFLPEPPADAIPPQPPAGFEPPPVPPPEPVPIPNPEFPPTPFPEPEPPATPFPEPAPATPFPEPPPAPLEPVPPPPPLIPLPGTPPDTTQPPAFPPPTDAMPPPAFPPPTDATPPPPFLPTPEPPQVPDDTEQPLPPEDPAAPLPVPVPAPITPPVLNPITDPNNPQAPPPQQQWQPPPQQPWQQPLEQQQPDNNTPDDFSGDSFDAAADTEAGANPPAPQQASTVQQPSQGQPGAPLRPTLPITPPGTPPVALPPSNNHGILPLPDLPQLPDQPAQPPPQLLAPAPGNNNTPALLLPGSGNTNTPLPTTPDLPQGPASTTNPPNTTQQQPLQPWDPQDNTQGPQDAAPAEGSPSSQTPNNNSSTSNSTAPPTTQRPRGPKLERRPQVPWRRPDRDGSQQQQQQPQQQQLRQPWQRGSRRDGDNSGQQGDGGNRGNRGSSSGGDSSWNGAGSGGSSFSPGDFPEDLFSAPSLPKGNSRPNRGGGSSSVEPGVGSSWAEFAEWFQQTKGTTPGPTRRPTQPLARPTLPRTMWDVPVPQVAWGDPSVVPMSVDAGGNSNWGQGEAEAGVRGPQQHGRNSSQRPTATRPRLSVSAVGVSAVGVSAVGVSAAQKKGSAAAPAILLTLSPAKQSVGVAAKQPAGVAGKQSGAVAAQQPSVVAAAVPGRGVVGSVQQVGATAKRVKAGAGRGGAAGVAALPAQGVLQDNSLVSGVANEVDDDYAASDTRSSIPTVPAVPIVPPGTPWGGQQQQQQQQQQQLPPVVTNPLPSNNNNTLLLQPQQPQQPQSPVGFGVGGSGAVVIGAVPVNQAAQVLQLPDVLVLVRVDGSTVPDATVAAFRYVWNLLQGRLALQNPGSLATFQPGWMGGWLVHAQRASSKKDSAAAAAVQRASKKDSTAAAAAAKTV